MRKFKVLTCPQERTVFDIKRRRDDNGNIVEYKQYRKEKAGENDWWPGAYGHEKIKEGDILDLSGYRADKAAANPHFEEVFEKRKPGRPKKVKDAT